jgi:hypothetical protein
MKTNLSFKFDFLYVLIDMGNHGVVYATHSANAAKAVALGCQRLKIHPIATHTPWIEPELVDAEFDNLEKNYTLTYKGRKGEVNLQEMTTLEPGWMELRKEIRLRTGFHEALANLCSYSMASLHDSEFHVEYDSSINDELSKCSIADGVYTDPIRAYAQVTECDPQTAVEELTVHMDNLAHTRLRTLGIYIKYRNLLNNTPATMQDMKQAYKLARDALIWNASV